MDRRPGGTLCRPDRDPEALGPVFPASPCGTALPVLRAPLPALQNTAHVKPKPVPQKHHPVMGNGGPRAEQVST